MSTTLPTVFVSHGSPMHALEPGPAGAAWAGLARSLPRPRAILMASAHWETNVPMLTGSAKPETIHDFFGFPKPLYELRYPAPGAPELANRARDLLRDAGLTAAVDGCRGLDHGAWSPLLYMYPEADIPVVQLSLQPELGPRHHYRLGRAVAPLAEEGVLLFGSGHMTHNLRDWMRGARDVTPAPYAREFQTWVDERIAAGDHEALIEYRSRAPHAVRAHPTDEHFLPLFFALGAAGEGARPRRVYDAIEGGALAMDAYAFAPAAVTVRS
ncbi:MAG TPA: class III extradiol ring-cleavage dioxygenase [Burkholderiales bacterium]|nr:class III extradiol ring-cleavage dioxygenase [Burkholderiales bacterium]